MNLDSLTIGEARELVRLFVGAQSNIPDPNVGKLVIVRTYSAGVHVGTLHSRTGTDVVLTAARRIWSWQGANTLNEIALRGVGAGSRISETVPSITLTQAIEIIPVQEAAVASVTVPQWVK